MRCAWAASWRASLPDEPEVHGLAALMELQASRLRARVGPGGAPVLLADQNRERWDQLLIQRGLQPWRARRRSPAAWAIHAAGGHRRLPRAGAHGRAHGLATDRCAV